MAGTADTLDLHVLSARDAELRRFRWEAMARGEFPEIMNTEEAAYFLRRSVDWLRDSDAPRSILPGKGKGKMRDAVYVKTQLVAWAKRYGTYDAEEAPRVRHARRLARA